MSAACVVCGSGRIDPYDYCDWCRVPVCQECIVAGRCWECALVHGLPCDQCGYNTVAEPSSCVACERILCGWCHEGHECAPVIMFMS